MLALGFAALLANGRSLTPEEALQRFRDNTSGPAKIAAKNAASQQQPTLAYTATTSDGSPAAYVFSQPGNHGFIVLAGDDIALPLLGYADSGSAQADEMPPQMIAWLSGYAEEIEAANSAQAEPRRDLITYAAATDDREPIAPLCSTHWNQGTPYNNLCPSVGSKLGYTGCVATAMAQVMKYYNHPAKPSGSISYTTRTLGLSVSMNFNQLSFDWGNMVDNYDYYFDDNGTYHSVTTSATQNTAVATLMAACGASVKMDYKTNSSGAYSEDVPAALETYMGYASGGVCLTREAYSSNAWAQMVYDNLKNVGPVYYSGSSSEGGHAFVCDGYSSDDYFHFNWGWGGHYDGYFKLYALNPDGQGIGGFEGGYNQSQGIIVGIHPTDASAKPDVESVMTMSNYLTGSLSGTTITLKPASQGFFYNSGPDTFSRLYLGVEATSLTDGSVTYISSIYFNDLYVNYGTSSYDVNLSSLKPATQTVYRVSPVYSSDGKKTWKHMAHNQLHCDWVDVTVGAGGSSYTIGTQYAYNLPYVTPRAVSFTENGVQKYVHFIGRDLDMDFFNESLHTEICSPFCLLVYDYTNQTMGDGLCYSESLNEPIAPLGTTVYSFGGTFNTTLTEGERLVRAYSDELGGYWDEFDFIFREDPGTVAPNWQAFKTTDTGDNEMMFEAVVDLYHNEGVLTDAYYNDIFELDVFKAGATRYSAKGMAAPAANLQYVGTLTSEKQYLSKENGSVAFPLNGTLQLEPGTKYRAYLYSTADEHYTNPERVSAPASAQRYVEFTTDDSGVTTSVESIAAENGAITASYNAANAEVVVMSTAAIKDVTLFDAQGRTLNAPVAIEGNRATADLSGLAHGIVIVSVTDADGNRSSQKVIR